MLPTPGTWRNPCGTNLYSPLALHTSTVTSTVLPRRGASQKAKKKESDQQNPITFPGSDMKNTSGFSSSVLESLLRTSGSIGTALLRGAPYCLLFLETRKVFVMVTLTSVTVFQLRRRPLGQFTALSAGSCRLCCVAPAVLHVPLSLVLSGCKVWNGAAWLLVGVRNGSFAGQRLPPAASLCLGLLLTSVIASPLWLLQGFSHEDCQGLSTFGFFGGCLGEACGVFWDQKGGTVSTGRCAWEREGSGNLGKALKSGAGQRK